MKFFSKKNGLKLIFILILIAFFGFSIILNDNFINTTSNSLREVKNYDESRLKTAGSWVLSSTIIDNTGGGHYTWEQAVLQPWCNGSGTVSYPYLIQNVTFLGGMSSDCLLINNSKSHFKIENCTFIDTGSGRYGIKLNNVTNGLLIDNNCSNDSNGIFLGNCQN